jgi:hypothetical protein
MRQKMSIGSCRELLNRLAPRYQGSNWKEKGRILDEFVSSRLKRLSLDMSGALQILSTQLFCGGVSEALWNFRIGNSQVCE